MLECLFYPQSIAVIGASRTPGKVGQAILANLVNHGFNGRIIPINPHAEQILSRKCFNTLESVGEAIDLCIIAVPPTAVIKAVNESISAGAKAIVLITAGFKETGEEGARTQHEIASICAKKNVRLLGPNCLGFINTDNNLNASFAKQMPKLGGISIISQSGAICTAILDWSLERHLGLGKVISIGNKADIDESDCLRALACDDQTKVIAAYLESIESGGKFIKAAEMASARKPVIIIKSGNTKAGALAASSHTGSLAGGDTAYAAAFKRSGVIRANDFQSLFELATSLVMQPLPKGNRIAIITNAGGPGIMAADAAERLNFSISRLSPETLESLKKSLPSTASTLNPIDVLGDANPDRYLMAIQAAQKDDSIDAIIVILTPQAMTQPMETASAIIESAQLQTKPLLVSFMGGKDVKPGRELLFEKSLPEFESPERAVYALRSMLDYSLWRQRPPRVVTRYAVNRRRVARILRTHQKSGNYHIGEISAKEILHAYNFTIPTGFPVFSVEEAVEKADLLGYPIAMKIVSKDVIHKSDVGGVRINLMNVESVRDAFDLMKLRVSQKIPGFEFEGVYLEKMCSPGREIILGTKQDPQFGPMLMFGLGGVFVEILKDIAFHLAPITSEEAIHMLKETRTYHLLEGYRGEQQADINAIARCIQYLGQLVTDFPEITELDINPLIVGPRGVGTPCSRRKDEHREYNQRQLVRA